jgi:hypothetical protein
LAAHAAGTAVTNARALNNSGINRAKDTCREIRRRLTATWVECVIGSELRFDTVVGQALTCGKQSLGTKGSESFIRSCPVGALRVTTPRQRASTAGEYRRFWHIVITLMGY